MNDYKASQLLAMKNSFFPVINMPELLQDQERADEIQDDRGYEMWIYSCVGTQYKEKNPPLLEEDPNEMKDIRHANHLMQSI